MPTMFVIFAIPQQHGRTGTRYIAKDGSKTDRKSRAKKFYTHIDAGNTLRVVALKESQRTELRFTFVRHKRKALQTLALTEIFRL